MKYYAFWKYDVAPFMLGGEVDEFLSDGRVRVNGYTGYIFTPILVVPEDKGIEIKEKLKEAEEIYRRKTEEALKELKETLENFI